MSIFSKKSRSKEPEDKSKPQGNGTDKTVKPEQRRAPQRNAQPGVSQNGAPQSAAELTAQRAALMAASRKRMNSDNPDYSINGSFSSSKGRSSHPPNDKAQPVKSSHKTLVKENKPTSGSKKTKGISEVLSQDIKSASFFSGATFSRKSAPPAVHRGSDGKDDKSSLQPRTPQLPKDSPTLGYTPGAEETPPRGQTTSQPSADSGYSSGPRSSANTSRPHSVTNGTTDTRSASVPRVDSGVAPKVSSNSTKRTTHEDKSLVAPPGSKSTSRRGSKSGTYVSKLDPGPTSSDFASRLINFSKPSTDFSTETSSSSAMPSYQTQERRTSQSDQMNGRGRSTAQKPVLSPISQAYEYPQPPYAQPSRSVSSSRSADRPGPYLTSGLESPSSYRTAQSATRPTDRTYTLPNSKPSSSGSGGQQFTSGPPTSKFATTQVSKFADGTTLMALQSDGSDNQRAVYGNPNPAANANYGNSSSQPSPSSTTTVPNHHTAASSGSDESGRRLTLPPVSSLDGFKVNKRGQVLDEEGNVIGELFEGDLIDCVRQKLNADGEVIDEFGSVVGRVRPVRRGLIPAVRYSDETTRSGFQSPVYPRPMFSAASVHRRESAASQMASIHSPGGTVQQNGVPSALAAQTVVSPLDGQGNEFVAELDASTEVEAFPVMDHSDIFIPTFGSSQRSQSPSTLMKVELPATERRRRSSPADGAEEDASGEPKPKKWASRYFDPGPNDGTSPSTPASRRNSKSPAARRTSIMDSQAAPRRASTMDSSSNAPSRRASQATVPPTPTLPTPIVKPDVPASPRSAQPPANGNTNGAYKAVLGPTLEDLAEEAPSPRSLSANRAGGKSTPNLLAESQRLSVASPTGASPVGSRRASLQVGSSLHPNSARASYAPTRRSPLSNYEATPPGSAGDSISRTPSARAAASVPRGTMTASRDGQDDGEDDAAPAPEIPKARARAGNPDKKEKAEKTGSNNAMERVKTVEKRKSRFSFMR